MLMIVARGLLLVACSMTMAGAALTPGYEDELYCPPGACLVKKEVRGGLRRGAAAALRRRARCPRDAH